MFTRITVTILAILLSVVNSFGTEPMEGDRVASEARFQTVSYHQEPYDMMAKRLLKEGDFEGALSASRKALRTRETDLVLRREFEELQQVLRLRKDIVEMKSRSQRNAMAEKLRRYYLRHEIHGENIELAFAGYCDHRTAKNACKVIEALVNAEQYPQAIEFIDSLGKNVDERFQVEKARILVMDDRHGEAVLVLRSISMEKLDSPDVLLGLARLQALTRQNASAVKTLARCFELMPLARLKMLRSEVPDYPEFQPIRSAPEFLEVLQIRSQEPLYGKPCAQKWVGHSLYAEPEYIKKLGEKIDLDFWRVF